jgi:hypothetical protein
MYRRGLEMVDDPDAFINCGTALINQANLRSVMDSYASKTQACVPLLDLAMRMLERALSLGLDTEGQSAIQVRLRKCEELKSQALDDDAEHLSRTDLDKIVASMQRSLDGLKVSERSGKVKKETAGLMNRMAWKDYVLVLSATRIQWFVKDSSKMSNLKGEISLSELTAVKETIVEGLTTCFALVGGAAGFLPFRCTSRSEMEGWVQDISSNMQRLKLLNQISQLSVKK